MFILGGTVPLKESLCDFLIRHVTCKYDKNHKEHLIGVYIFFAKYGSVCEIDVFPVGVFSICEIWKVMETQLFHLGESKISLQVDKFLETSNFRELILFGS